MPFFYFDPTYMLLIPAIIFAIYAQGKIQSTYNRYSKVHARSGLTGAELAKEILHRNRIYDVNIEPVQGTLTDHYDPKSKRLRLSSGVYNSSSIAALGIAAHEVGHAIQHSTEYAPLKFRNSIVPIVNIGSQLSIPFLLIGLLLNNESLALFGILAFSLAVLFQLVTLPVEYNASNRALEALELGGFLQRDELSKTSKVLKAAALTYVASTLMAITQLFRLVLISGVGRRRD